MMQVCQHNCPVSQAAHEFPQLCDAEAAAFARLLGTNVTRLATIAHGDGVCTCWYRVCPAVGPYPHRKDLHERCRPVGRSRQL